MSPLVEKAGTKQATEAERQFVEWLKEGQTGCLFAQFLAHRIADAAWRFVSFAANSCDAALGHAMTKHVRESASSYNAIVFLFPDANDPEAVFGLLRLILADASWLLYTQPEEDDSRVAAVSLRWVDDRSVYIHWTVGFSSLKSMPPTRQSPCTAIVMKLGMPSSNAGTATQDPDEIANRRADLGKIPVHLADVPTLLQNEKQLRLYWAASQKRRTTLLAGSEHLQVAKAKVTFCFPPQMRKAIDKTIADQSIYKL